MSRQGSQRQSAPADDNYSDLICGHGWMDGKAMIEQHQQPYGPVEQPQEGGKRGESRFDPQKRWSDNAEESEWSRTIISKQRLHGRRRGGKRLVERRVVNKEQRVT